MEKKIGKSCSCSLHTFLPHCLMAQSVKIGATDAQQATETQKVRKGIFGEVPYQIRYLK